MSFLSLIVPDRVAAELLARFGSDHSSSDSSRVERVPNYAMIGWGKFMKHFRSSRILNLLGDFGTGKTLFSVALGYQMIKMGYVKTTSYNFPVCSLLQSCPTQRHNLGVIDEGGRLFADRDAYKDKRLNSLSGEMLFSLRKLGSYIVVPSVMTVDKRFRAGLRMWRVYPPGSGRSRWWWYRWERGEEDEEKQRKHVNYWSGHLLFLNPGTFYGSYDTYYAPSLPLTKDFALILAGQK